ncbi:MAG: hypothetical protein LCH93_06790 [Proteobacteria bacterium]|nr:hypothetical protein [Pseudomonadota bacterium]
MSLWSRAALLSVAIAAGAVAVSIGAWAQTAKAIPKGWFLHEELAPTLDLAFYEPTHVSFSVSCTKGYTDAVVAFRPEGKGPDGKTPTKLVLSRGAASVSIDATGQMFNGSYVVDGLTTMTPALADLLQGGFTLTVGGKEIKTYATTDQDRAHVEKLTQACRS